MTLSGLGTIQALPMSEADMRLRAMQQQSNKLFNLGLRAQFYAEQPPQPVLPISEEEAFHQALQESGSPEAIFRYGGLHQIAQNKGTDDK